MHALSEISIWIVENQYIRKLKKLRVRTQRSVFTVHLPRNLFS